MSDTDTTTPQSPTAPLIASGIAAATPLVALALIFTLGDLDVKDEMLLGTAILLVLIAVILAPVAYFIVWAMNRPRNKKP